MLTEQEKSLIDRQLMRLIDWKIQHGERLLDIRVMADLCDPFVLSGRLHASLSDVQKFVGGLLDQKPDFTWHSDGIELSIIPASEYVKQIKDDTLRKIELLIWDQIDTSLFSVDSNAKNNVVYIHCLKGRPDSKTGELDVYVTWTMHVYLDDNLDYDLGFSEFGDGLVMIKGNDAEYLGELCNVVKKAVKACRTNQIDCYF